MAFKAVIDGRIVADPEDRKVSDKFSILQFPLYADRRVKNRETQEWESDPNGTTKLTVELKFDQRDQWLGKLHKGDIVKITGSIFEREYERNDGGKGRSLQTDFVESVEVIRSATPAAQPDSDVPF